MEGNCAPGSQGKYIYDIYFVKNPVDSGTILITYRSTEHKLAYFFTKSLQGHLFVKFRMLQSVLMEANIRKIRTWNN